MFGLGELEVASLLRYNCALVFWCQSWHQLGNKSASLLWVEITNFLRDIHKGGNNLVMAFLSPFFIGTASSTDLNGQLLTAGVSHKLARLLLNILGCARTLIHSPALLWSLTIAHLLNWLVALLDSLIESLLLECDGAELLKVLLTDLLLTWLELCDVGVVTLLSVLMCTLQDWLLLQRGHSLLLVNTTEASVRICYTIAEIHSTFYCSSLLSAIPKPLTWGAVTKSKSYLFLHNLFTLPAAESK